MLDVKHFLSIYKIRKRLYEEEITSPKHEIKDFITEIVAKLSVRPSNEELDLVRNKNNIHELVNKKGAIVITFPDFKELLKVV